MKYQKMNSLEAQNFIFILFSYHFVLFQPEISSLISQDLSPYTEFHGATMLTAIEDIYRPKNHERGSLVYWDDERGSFVYWDEIARLSVC